MGAGQLGAGLDPGDGVRGDDIVQQVRTIRNLPLVLPAAPEVLEVRGEIFMDDSSFTRLNESARICRPAAVCQCQKCDRRNPEEFGSFSCR